ncbi:MAG: hypothetical protein LUC92_06990 [Clostridiales bacterium]|nr:hypothetical protein [Clostridiales bacterium]
MTFDKAGNYSCYPKGIIKDDIRVATYNASPIIATLSKEVTEELFNKITYKSKNINTEKLHFPKDLVGLISEEALLKLKPNINSENHD